MITQRPDLASMVRHYQLLEGLGEWKITCEWVPDWDQWGSCIPIVDCRTAHIKVRDPLSTAPPPAMTYGDMTTEIKNTIAHELIHCWLAYFGSRTPAEIAVEENIAWSLSNAITVCEGQPDAIIMGKVISRLPERIRQKVSAAPSKARQSKRQRIGGRMAFTAEQIQEAIQAAGDDSPAATILRAMLADMMTAGGSGEPDGEPGAMPAEKKPPGGGGSAPPAPGDGSGGAGDAGAGSGGYGNKAPAMARRGFDAAMSSTLERARTAANLSTTEAIRSMVHNARTIDQIALPAEVEASILRCKTIPEAQAQLGIARAMVGKGPQRGKSGADPIEGAHNGGTGTAAGRGAAQGPRELSPRLAARLAQKGRNDLIERGRTNPAPATKGAR